ncbi:MAG: PDZ domain-containing protein [Chloroflexota bacterium]|nr:MAG: hypothetical protein DIU68_06135 [Chloroflexota bacterium]
MRRGPVLRITTLLLVFAIVVLGAGWALAQTDAETPVLGVRVEDDPAGALVTTVVTGSPADAAGIEVGDIVTALDGETVTADNLAEMIRERSVGDTVELEVLRGDDLIEISVTLGARSDVEVTPEPRPQRDRGPQRDRDRLQVFSGAFLGVGLTDTEEGIVIEEVLADSPAEEAGLEAGDVITAVNGEEVESASDVVEIVRGLQPGDTLTLDIERDGEAQTIEATLGEAPVSVATIGVSQNIIVYNRGSEQWHIVRLADDSALAEAGLSDGDIITAFDGEAYTPETLAEYLDSLEDDAEVTLSVLREGDSEEISVPAEALRELTRLSFDLGRGSGPFRFGMPGLALGAPQVYLGVTFVQLNEETAAEHGVDVTEGALIVEVDPDSPAASAGLQVDDIITAVDGDVVDEERTLRDRLFAYEPDDTVTLTVLRDGETIEIDVTLEQARASVFRGRSLMPFFFDLDRLDRFERFGIPLPVPRRPTPEAPIA